MLVAMYPVDHTRWSAALHATFTKQLAWHHRYAPLAPHIYWNNLRNTVPLPLEIAPLAHLLG